MRAAATSEDPLGLIGHLRSTLGCGDQHLHVLMADDVALSAILDLSGRPIRRLQRDRPMQAILRIEFRIPRCDELGKTVGIDGGSAHDVAQICLRLAGSFHVDLHPIDPCPAGAFSRSTPQAAHLRASRPDQPEFSPADRGDHDAACEDRKEPSP